MTDAYAFSFNETDDCIVVTTENTNKLESYYNSGNETNLDEQAEKVETQISTEKNIDNKDSNSTTPSESDTEIIDQTIQEVTNKTVEDKSPLLTYLLKNDIENTIQKPKGHEKNSLKRKKRSDINYRYGERPPKGKLSSNDYKSSYSSRDREYAQPLRNKAPANLIRSSNLADFNIETLHDNNQRDKNNPENQESERYRVPHYDYFKNGREGNRGSLRYEPKDSSKHEKNDDSVENNKYSEKPRSRERNNPETSDENYSENNRDVNSSSRQYSNENTDRERKEPYYKKNAKYPESQEIKEEGNLRPDYKSNYNKHIDESNDRESGINNKSPDENEPTARNRESYAYNRRDKPYSDEQNDGNEHESNPKKVNDKYSHKSRDHSNSKPPVAIQDVDLGDFSYERIKVNDKGQVEPVQELQENNGEKNPNNFKQKDKNNLEDNERYTSSQKTPDRPYRRDENEEGIPINDGEIKPVVEINSKSEELNRDDVRGQKENFSNKDKNIELNDDSNLKKEPPKNADVKQQFERIPLNYDHNKQKEVHNTKESEDPKNSEAISENSNQNTGNDESVETLPTTTTRYDENLNIKFDDISIKLPEIKLPDDVLAYNYDDDRDDEKQYYKEGKNNRNKEDSKYNDEENDESNQQHNDDNDDRDNNDEGRGYSRYYEDDEEKSNYQDKKNPDDEEEEDVDLYEKFVRERFGKQGSFGKRSENLQEDARKLPENPKLYETLQNILKKTEDTQKEAEKSGDPNAGYMWTLEYGENL